MQEPIYYCLSCGDIGARFPSDTETYCLRCDYPLQFDDLVVWSEENLQKYFDEHIKNNHDFNQKHYQERTERSKQYAEENRRKTIQTNTKVSCPKCGSTQIEAVNKKWSILTGFLTNKTQRFCLNCTHKF